MKKTWISCFALLMPLFAWAGPVNVNTADAGQISAELVGVGLKKAEAIIEYRNQNGAFETPEELLKVKGIGPRILADNDGNIRVND